MSENRDTEHRQAPERTPQETEAERNDQHPSTGAIGGDASPAADTPIGLPSDDDSPLGDTDQHSSGATAPDHPRR